MAREGSPRRRARLVAALLAAVVAAASLPSSAPPARAALLAPPSATGSGPTAAGLLPAHCPRSRDALARADELLDNVYRLGSHPAVTLPADLTWKEDPLRDANWRSKLHSLDFVRDLLYAWGATGSPAYRDRAVALLRDWLRDNPKSNPPSTYSWHPHTTAWRGHTLACAADMLSPREWLTKGLNRHGRTLADPGFYVKVGNYALDQSTALLEIGRVRGRGDWTSLATKRLNTLVAASVDAQGITNEQAIYYQYYNWKRYTAARERIAAAGLVPGPAFERVALMPRMLAHATLPNGEYEMIGDTSAGNAFRIGGTVADYAATQGELGPRPVHTVARYAAGYLFARTGWGESRPYEDEVFMSLRWGPAPDFHGHADGLALTMYGYGHRLLLDSGGYSYDPDVWRWYFKSRRAHNVVTVKGLAWRDGPTELLGHATGPTYTYTRLRARGFEGVAHTRRVLFSRGLGYAIVEDRLSSASSHAYQQLWHLLPTANPIASGRDVVTRRDRGNVLIRQLAGSPKIHFVSGASDPIQGWVSYAHKQKSAAPVVHATLKGASGRFVTLIVPASGQPEASVGSLKLTSTGYRLTITIGGRSERVVVDGSSASITALD